MIFFLKKKSKSFFLIFSCELILKSFAYANYLINIRMCIHMFREKIPSENCSRQVCIKGPDEK